MLVAKRKIFPQYMKKMGGYWRKGGQTGQGLERVHPRFFRSIRAQGATYLRPLLQSGAKCSSLLTSGLKGRSARGRPLGPAPEEERPRLNRTLIGTASAIYICQPMSSVM